MIKNLTPKKKIILDFINSYTYKNGFAPSMEEIKIKLKLNSVSTIHQHIEELKKSGHLNKIKNHPRAISSIKNFLTVEIPLLGNIAAGQPIETIEIPDETITIARDQIGKFGKHYALRVQGSSMIDDGIFDGDIVVIREQKVADDGQTVVAIIDDDQATLKKLYHENGRFKLQPANQTLLPFYRKEVEIRGVVEKIIRNIESNKEDDLISETDPKETFSEKKSNFDLNRIYNVDCLEFMKNTKDNSIDLIFADPPYNLSKSNFKMKFTRSGGSDLNTNKGAWDNFSKDDFEKFTKNWLTEAFRILKETGSIWVAGTYHNIHLTGYLMEKIGFEILNEILWHKTDATPNLSCTRFVADHENFLWARKSKRNTFNYEDMKRMNGGKQMRSIWPKGKTAGGKKVHPTQKPEWLLERVILSTSKKGDIVFDPFLGSGTTAIVAKKLKRSYIGTELDKDYFKLADMRIKNA